MSPPLAGIKVLDLSRVLAGPWAGQILADLGADVIKIEHPERGDDTRHWGPPYLKDNGGDETDMAAYYLSANRGKKSLALDISKPEGQKIIRTLARDSHILIENFRVDGLAQYGLDYASLKAECPHLIYCSITGFGQTGPKRDVPGYDYVIQAMSGLMSVTGDADGEPMKVGVAIADLATGLYGVVAMLAALRTQAQEGRGCHIDMALYDVMLGLLANQNMNYLTTGKAPGRMGNSHPNIVPYRVFDTADGQMVLAAGNDRQFQSFCRVVDAPYLADDPRFASNRKRVENRAALEAAIEDILRTRPTADWVDILLAEGIPAGPIQTIEEAFADPHITERAMRVEQRDALGHKIPGVRMPILMDGKPLVADRAPPRLAADSRAVLEGIGLNADDIEGLIVSGAVRFEAKKGENL